LCERVLDKKEHELNRIENTLAEKEPLDQESVCLYRIDSLLWID
jgi:hypothetical protein